ncbi:hypothetical protein A3Q56_04254 [Intoshia linei]|uniref:Grh/CP2 DB domain-containing protein n=1 Tax=Intoshia linei TaxID=1819745 RepID=A0A177B1C9_9BILA|nr:hypothetical protein A3Q56_04254 [Intoshia linei]
MQDITSDRLTYINRGQYYMLKIMMNPLSTAIEKLELNTTITSLIIITFREEYELQEELSMWEFWLARQEKKPRRIINIGYVKDNDSIAYEYLSLNSLSIKWNISTKYVSVPISIHCLSTDFTPQKGVKGVPLHIQVDSYVMSNKLSAFHSAFSQIKVFRDKGAGRKMRDEKKKLENMKKNNQFSNNLYHKQTNYTLFYRINNQKRKPLLFNPMQNKKFDEIENDQTDSEMPIISEQVNCEDSVKDNYNFDSISPTFSADYPKEETIHLIDEKPIIEQIDNVEPPNEECIIVNNKKYISTSTSTQEDSSNF